MMPPASMSPSNLFRKLINGLMRSARSYVTRSAMVVISICLMIWFFGPKLSYQDYKPLDPIVNRVIAIATVILLWGINNLIVARRQPRNKKEDTKEIEVATDPVDSEITHLRQSFANAMRTIREKWTGSERGTKSLYALPWFVVLGPPASGKTTLITNSDLKFPIAHMFGLDAVKNVRATEKPDYWVTNESVIFDLPGSWMQTDDMSVAPPPPPSRLLALKPVMSREARLWHAFMDLLGQYRPRRPINGVVLCLDLPELIRSNNDERANLASTMHSRLVELSEKLGTRFTVHIVVNKIDKMAGFQEFFAVLPRSERGTPFGFSFSVTDIRDTDHWVEEFNAQFKSFMDKINDELIDHFYSQRDTISRRNVYTFVRELAAIGPILSDFLKNALHSDRFSTPPMIRGVYFASPRQEGVAFNALLTRIAQEYDISAPIMPAYAGLSQPYFSERLFQNIIFKEAGLAGDNHAVEKRKQFFFNTTVLTCALTLLTFGFFLNQALQDNWKRADNVVSLTQAFTKMPKGEDTPSNIATLLPALNAIRSATDEFPGWRDASPARRYLTLYEGGRVGPKVEETYSGLLREQYLPAIAAYLKQDLIHLGKNPETKDGDTRLETLRAYLLLGDITKRDALNASENTPNQGIRFVDDWMTNIWQARYEGDKTTQKNLKDHLIYGIQDARLTTPVDLEVVTATQADLVRVPRDLRLFRALETLSSKQLPGQINFGIVIGPSFNLVFKNNPKTASASVVPNFYTKKGYLDFFIPQNKALSVAALEDAWVAGERENVQYSPEDLRVFRSKVLHRYTQVFIDRWFNGITSLEIVDFENVDHAVAVLEEINGPANPIGRLLTLVKTNTEIYDPKPVEIAAEKAAAAVLEFDENREQGLRVNRAFSQLNALTSAKEGEKPYSEELMAVLHQLEGYLREIKNGQASSKPIALERAKARAELKGDDPIYALRRISATLPSPLNKQLEKVADEAWKVVLLAAKRDLQVVWQEKVFGPYNMRLATRFPFRKSSPDEVSLEEFELFFGVNGEFENFFQQNLKTFVNEHTGEPIVIDGQSIRVSDIFLNEIKKVRRIRNVFFENKGTLSLRYSIKPVSLSQGMTRAVLNIEGQLVPYSNGPQRSTYILWPNALSSKQNSSQLSTFGSRKGRGANTLTFHGLWSSFRLLERATVHAVAPGSADLIFTTGAGQIRYQLQVDGQENPFISMPLSDLKLPQTL